MNKFTIVIPTLWKSNRIHVLIDELIKCNEIDEIILIDNNSKYYEHYEVILDKINLIQMQDNIYVNPAWNLGVSLSKNSFIALINDDVNFNTDIFKFFNSDNLNEYGIIGMDTTNYNTNKNIPILEIEDKRYKQRYGWGCFIIFDKKYWINIPDNIKLWFGDDYIRYYNPSPVSYLTDFQIITDMSTTSKDIMWNTRKHLDYENFKIIAQKLNPSN